MNIQNKMEDINLREMAKEMIFQITGKQLSDEVCCEAQGDSDFQIAMFYLRKANELSTNFTP